MTPDAPMLQARGLSWRAGGRDILRDVSLCLNAGEVLGVIGPNGAGKTSLLRLLAALAEPDRGSLSLLGEPYRAFSPRRFAARVGYLEQDARVHWPLRVERVVALGRLPYRAVSGGLHGDDRRAIGRAVELTGIAGLLERTVTTLSQGEKALVALARILAAEPRVLLADEPVAALDPGHQLLIMETLRLLRRRGPEFTALVVLHDLGLAARYCDRLLLLADGRPAALGTPAEVLTSANLRQYYGIEAEISLEREAAAVIPLRRVEAGAPPSSSGLG